MKGTLDRARWIALLALAVGTSVSFAMFRSLRHDDAFITLQFARNVARGSGYAFNAGEPVLATTSPLSTLLLASIARVVDDETLPQVAVLIGCGALASQALLLFALFPPRMRWTGLSVALLTWLGLAGGHAWLALETHLVAAFVLATLVALDRRREVWAGVFLGLAFLTRHDAALLIPIAVAGEWLRRRELPIRMLGTSLLVVSPWLLWATSHFGSPLPSTLSAKQRLTEPEAYARHYLEIFATQPWLALGLPAGLGVLTPALWLVGSATLDRVRDSRLVEVLVYGGSLFAAYTRIGPPAGHHWHLYPASLALCILVVLALAAIGSWSLVAIRAGPRTVAAIGATVACASFALAAANAIRFGQRLPIDPWLGGRHATYAVIASWTREHVRPRSSFLAVEIGTLGYLSELRMIDACGLINATNDFPRTQSLAAYLELVQRFRPDLVLANTPADAQRIAAAAGYRIAHRFPWRQPWGTLLVRSGDVLHADPAPPLAGPWAIE